MSSLRVDSIESVTPESSLEIKSDLIMIGAMSATTIHVGDSAILSSGNTITLIQTGATVNVENVAQFNNFSVLDYVTSATINFNSGGTVQINANPRKSSSNNAAKTLSVISVGDEYFVDSNSTLNINTYNLETASTINVSSATVNLYETANTLTFNGETTVNNFTVLTELTSSTINFSGGGGTVIVDATPPRRGVIKLKPQGSLRPILSVGDEVYFDSNANVNINTYNFDSGATVTVSSGTINLYETANTLSFNGETTVNDIRVFDSASSATINFSGGGTTIINAGGPRRGIIKLKPQSPRDLTIGNMPTYNLGNNSTLIVSNYSLFSGGSIVAATGATVNLFETGNTVNISGTNTINNYTYLEFLTSGTVNLSGGTLYILSGGSLNTTGGTLTVNNSGGTVNISSATLSVTNGARLDISSVQTANISSSIATFNITSTTANITATTANITAGTVNNYNSIVYSSYSALISYTSTTSSITTTVLQNTLGVTPTWSPINIMGNSHFIRGSFSSPVLKVGKTQFFIGTGEETQTQTSYVEDGFYFTKGWITSTSAVTFAKYDLGNLILGNAPTPGAVSAGVSGFTRIPVEIRVYP